MNEKTQGSRISHGVGTPPRASRGGARLVLEIGLFVAALLVAAESAVWFKQNGAKAPTLAVVTTTQIEPAPVVTDAPAVMPSPAPAPVAAVVEAPEAEELVLHPEGTRFFDGRPLRAAKTIMMTVTAYSPDWRSCGDSADGITASQKSVYTNGGKMVAADTRVLPMNSMITVPGYSSDEVVPVLDRGGAIKGKRLDVLFPTHEAARKWGVRRIPVTVWEFADTGAKARASSGAPSARTPVSSRPL